MTNVYRSVHKLELVLSDSGVAMPVVSAETVFAFGQIPSAVVQLAVGRDADGKPAAVHSNPIPDYAKVELRLTSRGQYDENNDWPEGPQVIFRGLVDNRAPSRGSFTVNIVHWLQNLNFSTALVAASHPSNPADLTHAAMRRSIGAGGGLAVGPAVTLWGGVVPIDRLGISKAKVAADVWANCFKEILCQLAKQEHLDADSGGGDCKSLAGGDNTQALEALALIDGPSTGCARPYACYAKPLAFDGAAGVEQAAAAIYDMTMQDTLASFLNTTLWDKLIHSYAPSVMCTVIPLIEHALFVPVVAGFRGTYLREIQKDEIQNYAFSMAASKPLRGVGVISAKQDKTAISIGDAAGENKLAGCYAPIDADQKGMVLFVHAPKWLSGIIAAEASPSKSTKMDKLPNTAFTISPEHAYPQIEDKSRTTLTEEAKDLFGEYAHVIYITEKLRGRAGRIVGKLRFDIAPGSTVKVTSSGDPFINEQQTFLQAVGTVMKVVCQISATPAQSYTSFELAYVRTVDENKSDSFSIEAHPLFKDTFYGAPLTEALAFGPYC